MTLVKSLLLSTALLLGGTTLLPAPVYAATVADKVDMQGKPKYLTIDTLRMATRNGMLVVEADIKNRHNDPETLLYRVTWLDNSGMRVWEEEAWKPYVVQGTQKTTLHLTAPTKQATDFRLEVNSPENTQ